MKRKAPLILLCLVFLGMTIYFGGHFYLNWSEYRAGEKAYEELTQYIHKNVSPATEVTQPKEGASIEPESHRNDTAPTEVPDDTVWPVVDFEALHAINPDVAAWIYIEGTNINYPVVQGSDNSYYLNRLFDGTSNGAGTIFMDYRNRQDLSDRNTVLYGHHMQNGTMFQQITEYKQQEFYDQHPVCLIMTPNGNYRLEFFAGYITDMNDQSWKMEFASDKEYAGWLQDAVSKSLFISTVEPAAQHRVMTLSTCTYEYNDARFVLVGILKPQRTL